MGTISHSLLYYLYDPVYLPESHQVFDQQVGYSLLFYENFMANVLVPPCSGSVGHSPLCLEWMLQLRHGANVHGFRSGDALVESSRQIVARDE